MISSPRQQLRLFRVFGITVFLHWTWFLVAAYELSRASAYRSFGWNVAEYLSLFAIVLMHEFGHALACRQVGGTAHEIILWPLGGIAFVAPPPRPGANLWSIAAGPLVNVVLALPLAACVYLRDALPISPDATYFLWRLCSINLVLLVFNLLPVYPLDGGQILRSLLWFPFGRVRSLQIAAAIGVAGAAALGMLALWLTSLWTGLLAAFIGSQCWRGFAEARRLKEWERLEKLDDLPRHDGYACPACHAPPPQADLWICAGCGTRFNPFESAARCPSCGNSFDVTTCPQCRQAHPLAAWEAAG